MSDILITYRFTGGNGDPGQLAGRIEAAVQHFYQARHSLPAGVVVNPLNLVSAAAAMLALDLHLPVTVCGGCHLCEVWLEMDGKGG